MYGSDVGCHSPRIALSEGDAVYVNDVNAMRDELTDSPLDSSAIGPRGKSDDLGQSKKDAPCIE